MSPRNVIYDNSEADPDISIRKKSISKHFVLRKIKTEKPNLK